MTRAARTAVAALVAGFLVTGAAGLGAQDRGEGQARPGGQGRAGQLPPGGRGGVSPREIQAQFDAYVVAQAEEALQITEEQYPQFVRRVRALQTVRRQARIERTRMIQRLNAALRGGQRGADQPDLAPAIRALDDHERNTLAEVQKAYAALDEVLTPWQRARFRVLEDQLEQKKVDMLMRARQPIRR